MSNTAVSNVTAGKGLPLRYRALEAKLKEALDAKKARAVTTMLFELERGAGEVTAIEILTKAGFSDDAARALVRAAITKMAEKCANAE